MAVLSRATGVDAKPSSLQVRDLSSPLFISFHHSHSIFIITMGYLIPSRPKKGRRKSYKVFNLKFSSLIRGYTPQTQPIADIIQHHYLGRRSNNGNVVALVKGQIRNANEIQDLLSTCKDRTVLFRPGGLFALQAECPFGEGYIPDLAAKLRQLIRLTSLLRSFKNQNFNTSNISLKAVTFTYPNSDASSETTPLSCTINIPADHSDPLTLTLNPAESNPHTRIRSFLESSLNRSPTVFCHALKVTLPGMRAFLRLEAYGAGSVRTRGMEHYRIAYIHVPTVFNVGIAKRRNVPEIQIYELPPPSSTGLPKAEVDILLSRRPPGYAEAMKKLFTSKGDGWTGRANLICCTAEGLEHCIDALDATVREFWLPHQNASQAQPQAPVSVPRQQNRGPGPGAQVITLD